MPFVIFSVGRTLLHNLVTIFFPPSFLSLFSGLFFALYLAYVAELRHKMRRAYCLFNETTFREYVLNLASIFFLFFWLLCRVSYTMMGPFNRWREKRMDRWMDRHFDQQSDRHKNVITLARPLSNKKINLQFAKSSLSFIGRCAFCCFACSSVVFLVFF